MSTSVIQVALQEFLAEQADRLSPKGAADYRGIVEVLRRFRESYWPGHSPAEYDRIVAAGGSFCETFSPEEQLPTHGAFPG